MPKRGRMSYEQKNALHRKGMQRHRAQVANQAELQAENLDQIVNVNIIDNNNEQINEPMEVQLLDAEPSDNSNQIVNNVIINEQLNVEPMDTDSQPSSYNLNSFPSLASLNEPRHVEPMQINQIEQQSSPVDPLHKLVNYKPDWVEAGKAFDTAASQIVTLDCSTCKRSSPTLKLNATNSCSHCVRSLRTGFDLFSADNRMEPGDVPDELQGLTRVEQELVAKISSVVSFYRVNGQQYKYKGNCISFHQNIESYSRILPVPPASLSSIIVFSKQTPTGVAEFQVNRQRVLNALLWLKDHNPYYSDIIISEENLSLLPVDGDISHLLMSLDATERGNERSDTEQENAPGHHANPNNAPDLDGIQESFLLEIDPVNNEEQIRRSFNLPYPSIDPTPINEFTEEGFLTRAFPCLFPYGEADLNQARHTKVSLIEYFQFLMEYRDRRFVTDTKFRFFALNMLMRHQTLTKVGIYMSKSVSAPLNVQEIRYKLIHEPAFLRTLMAYGASVRGSKFYWFQRCGELLDFAEQIGIPTIFLTLSAADYHWPDLFRFLDPDVDLAALTEPQRKKLMHTNPDRVAFYFKARAEIFIKLILEPLFKVDDMWYRYEWQWRGSSHLHGLFWLSDSYDLSTLDDVLNDQEAMDRIIEYYDNLCTAINPDPNCPRSAIFPARKRFTDIGDSLDERLRDLTEFINRVQRHTQCGNHCWKSKTDHSCRFKFPITSRERGFIKNSKNAWEFHPARNDDLMNKYNSFIGQVWRANHDMSVVADKQALLNYIAKYASKAEKSSTSYIDLMKDLTRDELDETPAKRLLSKFMISSNSERNLSAQEVMHLLMGWNLYHSSRKFVIVSLGDEEWQSIQIRENEDNVRTGKSVVERYCLRPRNLFELSLLNYAKRYSYYNGGYHQSRQDAVVRVFPRLKLTGVEENDTKYYRQKVILNVPFRGDHFDFDNLLADERTRIRYATWKERYDSLGLEAQLHLEVPELDSAELAEVAPPAYPEMLIDEMYIDPHAAQVGALPDVPASQNLGMREMDRAFQWTSESQGFPSIQAVTKFLRTFRREAHVVESVELDPNIVFSERQAEVLRITDEQIQFLQTGIGDPPRRVAIQGKAGTGKSTLILAIKQKVKEAFGDDAIRVGAFTGVAARNIQGNTLHTIFHIPVGTFHSLNGPKLQTIQNEFRRVRVVIIDEDSMVSPCMLKQIDIRCREAKCEPRLPFGGLMVYMLGDFRQLPPVKMGAFYQTDRLRTAEDIAGKALFVSFDKFIELNVCYRQGGDESAQFRSILDNIGDIPEGGVPMSDYQALMDRREIKIKCRCGLEDCARCIETKSFDSAVRLFATNAKVDEENDKCLRLLGKPVARIVSKNRPELGAIKKGSSWKHVLNLSIGCRVMLRRNIAVEHGLVNGSLGTVEALVYDLNDEQRAHPPALPLYVLVKFDSYTGPSFPINSGLFPIVPIDNSWKCESQSYTRTQLPLSLAHAMTIHKAQGMTLPKAVVELAETETDVGLTYVQLSRVSKLTDLLIMGYFDKSRLDKIAHKKEHKQLKDFIAEHWKPQN